MFRKCFRIRNVSNLLLLFVIFVLIFILLQLYSYKSIHFFNIFEKQNKYEQEIRDYESRVIYGLGAEGKAAYLDGEEKKMGQLSLKTVALNTVLSDRIPLDRALRDPRHPECRKLTYNVHINASVIIIFYNEPFSVILRTVWSIILRTPHNLLHEIILVDDASDSEPLGKRLEHYINTRLKDYPVKLTRATKRLGLIRARLKGAREASGQVLVFLDAHCETTDEWIEPLLARIEESRTTVVVPIIDVIEADTLLYSTNGHSFQVGGFSWSGHFTWINVQKSEKARITSPVDPVKSPTMAGGLFAVDRSYFWEIGSYDEQMDGWGGENLEMSFRIWQCGGRLETVPCSRVGHIFREFHPYKFPSGKDTHGINSARMAMVWMDKYAHLYFLHQTNYKNNPVIGDLTHRIQLRNKLHCKPFSWYLKNVYPEKFVPTENVKAYGQLKTAENKCADNLQLPDDSVGPLGMYQCHPNITPTQLFSLTKTGQLRQEESCAEVTSKNTVQLAKCHGHGGSQEWVFDRGSLINPQTGLCLSAEEVQTEPLLLKDCVKNSPYQNWKFEKDN